MCVLFSEYVNYRWVCMLFQSKVLFLTKFAWNGRFRGYLGPRFWGEVADFWAFDSVLLLVIFNFTESLSSAPIFNWVRKYKFDLYIWFIYISPMVKTRWDTGGTSFIAADVWLIGMLWFLAISSTSIALYKHSTWKS